MLFIFFQITAQLKDIFSPLENIKQIRYQRRFSEIFWESEDLPGDKSVESQMCFLESRLLLVKLVICMPEYIDGLYV